MMNDKTYTITWRFKNEPSNYAEVSMERLDNIVNFLYNEDSIKWRKLYNKWNRELSKQRQLNRR